LTVFLADRACSSGEAAGKPSLESPSILRDFFAFSRLLIGRTSETTVCPANPEALERRSDPTRAILVGQILLRRHDGDLLCRGDP
jgi:hypothetical protein